MASRWASTFQGKACMDQWTRWVHINSNLISVFPSQRQLCLQGHNKCWIKSFFFFPPSLYTFKLLELTELIQPRLQGLASETTKPSFCSKLVNQPFMFDFFWWSFYIPMKDWKQFLPVVSLPRGTKTLELQRWLWCWNQILDADCILEVFLTWKLTRTAKVTGDSIILAQLLLWQTDWWGRKLPLFPLIYSCTKFRQNK